ncbi:unnamed protein product [Rhizophagus irregularis]|nr:unnamed protein product [Rhizophagus irregularis]
MSSPTSKNYITCGENDNEFNITMPPTILNLKDLNSKNCKEFTIIIIGFIELKGKAFLVPPSIEMSVTAFGTNLGYVKGDLEQVALLNMNVPFIDGDCGEIKLLSLVNRSNFLKWLGKKLEMIEIDDTWFTIF